MIEHSSKEKNPYDVELPQSVVESFARFLVTEIRKFYESEEGQQAFKEWQEHKEKNDV